MTTWSRVAGHCMLLHPIVNGAVTHSTSFGHLAAGPRVVRHSFPVCSPIRYTSVTHQQSSKTGKTGIWAI